MTIDLYQFVFISHLHLTSYRTSHRLCFASTQFPSISNANMPTPAADAVRHSLPTRTRRGAAQSTHQKQKQCGTVYPPEADAMRHSLPTRSRRCAAQSTHQKQTQCGTVYPPDVDAMRHSLPTRSRRNAAQSTHQKQTQCGAVYQWRIQNVEKGEAKSAKQWRFFH